MNTHKFHMSKTLYLARAKHIAPTATNRTLARIYKALATLEHEIELLEVTASDEHWITGRQLWNRMQVLQDKVDKLNAVLADIRTGRTIQDIELIDYTLYP